LFFVVSISLIIVHFVVFVHVVSVLVVFVCYVIVNPVVVPTICICAPDVVVAVSAIFVFIPGVC